MWLPRRTDSHLADWTIGEQGAVFARRIDFRLRLIPSWHDEFLRLPSYRQADSQETGKPRLSDEEDDGGHGASLEQQCGTSKNYLKTY